MRKLSNKTNVDAPSASYPYGRMRDNPGDNTGTPVNEEVYGDFHQFFEAMFAAAGITHNNLPESATNGFQSMDALRAYIRTVAADQTSRGVARLCTNAEVLAGIDNTSIVTPLRLTQRTATETRNGLAEIATQAETDAGTDNERIITPAKLAATPLVMHVDGTEKINTKIISIGDWDMDGTTNVDINHGIADYKKIRAVSVVIRDDSDALYRPLNCTDSSLNLQGAVTLIGSTQISLARLTGGLFDGTSYNATTFNRGFITITYTS